jgi:two-component system chemotaxis response regulator CheB
MPGHDLIVIGASAGGVETLQQLLRGLPSNLPAALCVVIHISANSLGVLPRILSRAGALPAAHPEEGEPVQHGRIYVAPPDRHLVFQNGVLHTSRGPRENGHRPAVDPLFRSAAVTFGPRVIGVILSGNLDDGTAGLQAVKRCGGLTVVQDPEDALFSGMPANALQQLVVDHVVLVEAMSPLLVQLAQQPVPEGRASVMQKDLEAEARIADLDLEAMKVTEQMGPPAEFACPECGGSLYELHDGQLVRFRCRVGHAYSPETLAAEQSQAVEGALWTALRALEERVALSRRLAYRMGEQNQSRLARRYTEQADDAEQHAKVIRQLLLGGAGTPPPEPAAETSAENRSEGGAGQD